MSARSVRKGKVWERELVRMFREAMPGCAAFRGMQFRDGSECADVMVPYLHIEAKHMRLCNHRAALQQAIADAPADKWPVAICKDDRTEATVTMRLEDFLDLVGEWWARGNR